MKKLDAQDFKRFPEVPTQDLPESLVRRVTERVNELIDDLPWYLRVVATPLYKRLRLMAAKILKDVADEVSNGS